ncbi:MAG: GEVED domain-containing protein, partial [Prochlorotrichaceae cyanobacterium]
PGLRLGTAIDGDNGTLQNAAADAHGADEDGVASFPALDNRPAQIYNVTVSVTNSTGSNAYLVGYIDFNGDGDFDDTYEQSGIDLNWDGDFLDAGEQVGTVLVPSNATNPRDFTVTFVTPSGMKTGTTYARFRLSNTQSEVESPIGAATSGEVEDYSLTVTDVSQGPTFLCDPSFYIVTGSRNVPRTSQLYRINRSTSPYSFDPIGVATIQGNLATDITYPTNFNVNAIGYNLTQDYIYGIIEGSDRPDTTPFDIPYRAGNIVRIDANGRVFDLGTPRQSGNPIIDIEIGNGAPSGAVLADGTTYVLGKEEANDNNDPQGIYLIDITQTPPTFTKSGDLPGYLNDIFLNPLDTTTNRIYTIPENDSNNQPNRLSYFDVSNPTSGLQSFATNTTGLTVNYGSQYVDSFGTVYFRSATNNNLYYLGDTGANQILDGAPAGGNHDGTSCPSVELRKAASPSSIPVGNNVTYTYQIANARLTPVTLTFRDQLDSVIDYAATVADEAAAQVGNVATFIGTGSGDLTALAVTSDSVTVVNGSVNTSIAISQAAINSGTTTFSNTNRTLEISGMTIPAQSLVSFSVDVNIPSGATPQNYYNQAELQNPTDGTSTSLPAQILSDSFTTAFFQDPTQITVTPSVATNPDLWLIRV